MTLIRFRHWIQARPRRMKRLLLLFGDFLGLMVIVWLAFCFRFESLFVPNNEQAMLIVAAPLLAIPIFVRTGLYRSVLRYLPERAIWKIVQAVTFATLAWVALVFLTRSTGSEGIPRTVAVLYWVSSIAAVAGSRFGIKWLLSRSIPRSSPVIRSLIYGADDAGVQLADALRSAEDREVVGFVSDDPGLVGMDILGLRVHPPSQLEQVVANFGIDEVIVTSSSGSSKRDVVARLGGLPVKIRVLPAIADLAAGRYIVSYVRDIDLDDLLGRTPVPADPALVTRAVEGRVIMVTGAGGSIGSALCQSIASAGPAKLILFDINEHRLYELERQLRGLSSITVVPVLGSVVNAQLVRHVLTMHAVDTIYHCAAYKHVSMVETNRLEGVRNNVLGTHVLAEAAHAFGVENFILISTDKAVHPKGVMGATKRWAELIVRHYGSLTDGGGKRRNFASVRFGNVIGSSGSVVPLFKEQIAAGGPITITHDDMMRYFMSVREAADLIVQAGALSRSGDILMLDMGDPIRIRDLAENMVVLAGLTVRGPGNPDGDIEIVTIGIREGEKLREDLFYDPANVAATAHPKILRAMLTNGKARLIPSMLEKLSAAVEKGNEAEVERTLFGFLTESDQSQPVVEFPRPAAAE